MWPEVTTWKVATVWQVGEKRIGDLIQLIDDGAIALPQFQRPSVWGKSNWVPFLMTILMGRPTGTLLLMEASTGDILAPRPIETAPNLQNKRLRWLLLDGQQRSTTLYKAARTYFGNPPRTKKVLVDVKAAIAEGELKEEHFTVEQAGAILNVADMARSGKADFATFLNPAELEAWRFAFITEHMSSSPEQFTERIAEIAPALLTLSDYRFPVLEIKDDTPLEVVADIFEGMNRRGQPLNKFDLMVARLYRPAESGQPFDLRDSWMSALAAAPSLQRLGIAEDDGMLPLQLIAKQVSRGNPADRGRVRGLNSKDVLELPAEQIIGLPDRPIPGLDLDSAVRALEAAASFLISFCGVVAPALLPQRAMLLPLADQFLRPANKRLSTAQLKSWFFSVGLMIDYYGSVNSYAERDCNRLDKWVNPSEGRVPESVTSVSRDYILGLDLSQPFTREGNILGRTVMAALVAAGALDWSPGQKQVNSHDIVDFHHMVPEQRLKVWFPSSPEDRRPICALTPITASANRGIGSKNAADVIVALGNHADPIMTSHSLDLELLEKAWASKKDFEAFRKDREARLKNFLIGYLGL